MARDIQRAVPGLVLSRNGRLQDEITKTMLPLRVAAGVVAALGPSLRAANIAPDITLRAH